MHKRWIGLLLVSTGLITSACQDPGCIRNSQCKSGLECRDSKCQAPLSAAGNGGGGGVSGASKTSAGTSSVPRSSGGSGDGSSAPSVPAPNPDAGMSM